MYSLSESARTGRRPQGVDGRELPVLFHLIDVSLPRTQPSEPTKPVEAGPNAVTLTASEQPVCELPAPPVATAACAVSSEPVVEKKAADPPVPSLPTVSESTETSLAPVASTASASPSDTLDVVVAAAVEASAQELQQAVAEETSDVKASGGETPEPVKSPPLTPRSTVSNRRKAKTSASEDWFASHGKFIAMVFVIALVGTVYLARMNRQRPADQPSTAVTPTLELTQSSVAYETPAGQGISNKLVETVSATSESKVDLLPPAATKSATGVAAADHSPTTDKLFVFPTKKTDERVATRSEPAASAEQVADQPVAAPALTTSYPTTSNIPPGYPTANSNPPAYPTATPPKSAYPVTTAPAVAYPAAPAAAPPTLVPNPPLPTSGNPPVGYRSPYQPSTSASPQQAWQWSPPAGVAPPPIAAAPGAYQSFDNTARGSRYERTGSGNY